MGPAGESDQELLATTHRLYTQAGLARAYYSAFNPVGGTDFEAETPTNPVRAQRLYQADWLLRFYGFGPAELPFDGSGNLPLASDPKLVWAQTHLSQQPVEISRASRGELLRVPGIGPKTAEAILTARRQGRLGNLEQLKRLGVQTERAAPYVLLHGRQPTYQLRFNGW